MKKLRLVRQTEQDTCGAACLAMLAGSTEQKMLEFLTESGHFDNGTTKTDIRWALNKLGIFASRWWFKDGLWRTEKKALIHFAYSYYTVRLHWIIWYNKKYYDPSWGVLDELFHFSTGHNWQKVVEYLPIYD
jgi:predicted double-glycine peptidase